MKRKRTPEDLPPEEQERRRMQKELQALAQKLRSSGQDYKPQKHKRKVYKEHLIESGTAPPKKKKEKKEKKSKHDTPKWRPYEACDVVIIPIYWNMHHEEKASVIKAAEHAASLMSEAGISSQVDAANQYTPGQKMKYWETAGVRVRVEVGPKEAQTGTAVVARAGDPGTVAKKTSVNVAVQLVREVKAAMQEVGVKPSGKKSKKPEEGAEDVGEEGVKEEEEEEQEGGEDRVAEEGEEGEGQSEEEEGGETEEGGEEGEEGGTAGAKQTSEKTQSNREKKKLRRERKKAALREAGGKNVQEGSRRDKRRKAKEAFQTPDVAEDKNGATAATESGSDEGPGEGQAPVASVSGHVAVEDGAKQGKGQQDGEAATNSAGSAPGTAVDVHTNGTGKVHKKTTSRPAGASDGLGTSSPAAKADNRVGKGTQKGGDMDISGKEAVQDVHAPVKARAVHNPDDLVDDFEIQPEFMAEPEEDALTLSKLQRIKKAKKDERQRKRTNRFKDGAAWDAPKDGSAGPAEQAGAVQGQAKAKKAKVVVF